MPTRTITTLIGSLTFPDTVRASAGGSVWVTDSVDGTVLHVDPAGKMTVAAKVPGRPAGLGLLPDGTPLVVSSRDRKVFKVTGSGLELHADLSPLMRHDAHQILVDPKGRAYVGSLGFDLDAGDPPATSVLVGVEPDGSAWVAAYDLLFPNGLAFADGGATLLVAETFGNRISAFERRSNGTLASSRVWAELGATIPAGLAAHRDGSLFVTDPVGQTIVRVGQGVGVLEELPTPGRHCFSCDLDEADPDRLLVASAGTANPTEARELRDGRIEVLSVGS